MKNMLRLTLSIGLSAAFLYLALDGVDKYALLDTLRGMHPGWLVAFVGSQVFTQLARAVRWRILVRPFCQVDMRAIWRISNVGNMLIMLLPLRLGEFARPYLLKKERGASLTAGMGAALVERVLDGLLVTLMFFVSTWTLDETHVLSPTLQWGSRAALALFAGAFGAIVLTLYAHDSVPALLRALAGRIAPGPIERIIAFLHAFVQGLRALPNARATFAVVAWTLAYWCANALGMYWLMGAFGWDLPVVAGFTVVCVLVISIMVPAGPGFIGLYQAAVIAGLGVYHVDRSDAAAYSLVAWVLTVVVLCAFGMPYFIGRNHLQMSEMVHANEAR